MRQGRVRPSLLRATPAATSPSPIKQTELGSGTVGTVCVTALVVVVEEPRHRRLAFKVAIVLYLLAVLDMGINVCISGVVGWKT